MRLLCIILSTIFFVQFSDAANDYSFDRSDSAFYEDESRVDISKVAKDDVEFRIDLQQETGFLGTFSKESGPNWLTVESDGMAKGIPRSFNEGYNDFKINCRQLSGTSYEINLMVYVDCGS